MAQITINIPDELVARVVKALCDANQVPVSNANAKKAIISYVKQTLIMQEIKEQEKLTTIAIDDLNKAKEATINNVIANNEAVTIN